MLRTIKILLILAVAAWGFTGGLLNVLHWKEGTLASVLAAISMDSFDGGSQSWQATSNPIIAWLGALFIAGSKVAAGILCLAGAIKMWNARNGEQAAFTASKELAIAGCGVALLMLFGGFIVVAETWFEMWRSDSLRDASLQSAFRYGGMITLIALFVGMKEP